MVEILRPYIDQGIMRENITFSNETRQFNINFDGDSKHQFEILKTLVNNNIDVVQPVFEDGNGCRQRYAGIRNFLQCPSAQIDPIRILDRAGIAG